MPELRCPTCDTTADLVGRGVEMESMSRKIVRQGKHGRRPVFKCKVCSAMLIVRSGLFGGISVRHREVVERVLTVGRREHTCREQAP